RDEMLKPRKLPRNLDVRTRLRSRDAYLREVIAGPFVIDRSVPIPIDLFNLIQMRSTEESESMTADLFGRHHDLFERRRKVFAEEFACPLDRTNPRIESGARA